MKDCYLGVDIGSISTKGVIIDENNNIITKAYIWTEGNPTNAVRKLLDILKQKLPKDFQIKGIGTTGSARKLIGLMLKASVVKNEITAHAVGTTTLYPDVRTIFGIGGQGSNISLSESGVVVGCGVSTLCAGGAGRPLYSLRAFRSGRSGCAGGSGSAGRSLWSLRPFRSGSAGRSLRPLGSGCAGWPGCARRTGRCVTGCETADSCSQNRMERVPSS